MSSRGSDLFWRVLQAGQEPGDLGSCRAGCVCACVRVEKSHLKMQWVCVSFLP